MRFSVVWYSQILTQKLGMKKLQIYINKLSYGNMDLSGDIGKDNGLTNSWLSSSLKITPIQQVAFIETLTKNELPFSQESQKKTKHLIKLMEEMTNGWNLHGKTGGGTSNGKQEGYFVGFAEKNGKVISFAIHTTGTSGMKARKVLITKMRSQDILK